MKTIINHILFYLYFVASVMYGFFNLGFKTEIRFYIHPLLSCFYSIFLIFFVGNSQRKRRLNLTNFQKIMLSTLFSFYFSIFLQKMFFIDFFNIFTHILIVVLAFAFYSYMKRDKIEKAKTE